MYVSNLHQKLGMENNSIFPTWHSYTPRAWYPYLQIQKHPKGIEYLGSRTHGKTWEESPKSPEKSEFLRCWCYFAFIFFPQFLHVNIVDASEIPFPTTGWMVLKPVVNNGIFTQPQLVQDFNKFKWWQKSSAADHWKRKLEPSSQQSMLNAL